MKKKIFYLVGSARCGSTVIYNALCSNNKFNPAIPENHLVNKFCQIYDHQINRNNIIEKEFFFENKNDTKKYFYDCLELFFNRLLKKYNCEHLLLKSIALGSNLHILNEINSSINYIMVVRDPRDIITSMIKVGVKQEKINIKNQYPRNMNLLCDHVNYMYRLLFIDDLKYLIEEKVFLIKYENFVSNTNKELNEITKKFLLKLEYSKDLKVWSRSSQMFKTNDDNTGFKSDLWDKPVTDKRINEYKSFLTPEEIDIINEKCKKLIERFNYI